MQPARYLQGVGEFLELKMKIALPTWPREATVTSAGRPVPRRQRHGVEYGLVLAILCFASISTFNAITAKHSTSAPEQVTVRYQ